MASRKPKVRTLHGIDHDAGRFRAETVSKSEPERLAASIGERCIAKQMARLEAQERRAEQ